MRIGATNLAASTWITPKPNNHSMSDPHQANQRLAKIAGTHNIPTPITITYEYNRWRRKTFVWPFWDGGTRQIELRGFWS